MKHESNLPETPTVKCLLIEDNYLTAMNIRKMLEELDYKVLEILHNKEEIENCSLFNEADVILSDVKISVDVFAYEILDKYKKTAPIILFSSYVDIDLYNECKKINPYIYITKPVDKVTLKSAIEGALSNKRLKSNNDLKVVDGKVFVKSKGALIGIIPNDVLYVESEGNYCYIYLGDKKIVIRSSLNNVMNVLNTPQIIKAQRGYLINTTKVTNVDISNEFIDIGAHKIPIGRKYKKAVLEHFK